MPKRRPDPAQQPELISEPRPEYTVTPEAQAEKEGYRRRLAAYLHDPEFRAIEGFPLGEDEAILALSDPPYYTACPNPFLPEIIEAWQKERSELRKALGLPDDSPRPESGEGPEVRVYHREPFATDVSEGKNDPIYNAHPYHAKAPHKAIMRYILHYTDPGDIVLDGFCGTGMTGVAAHLCGYKKAVEELGYQVQNKDAVLDERARSISYLGKRKGVLVDLSPAATFIAHNYNALVDMRAFKQESHRILKEVEDECGWMYETWHPNANDPNKTKGKINFTIWSDVFLCPECGKELIFWEVALDHARGEVFDSWMCSHCKSILSKNPKKDSGSQRTEIAFETRYDSTLGKTVRQAKQVPVLINYSIGNTRHEKVPDDFDLEILKKVDDSNIPYPFPSQPLPDGFNTRQPIGSHGLTHCHHFYTKRNLWVLSKYYDLAKRNKFRNQLVFVFTSAHQYCVRLCRLHVGNYFHKTGGVIDKPLDGTLYVPSLSVETNVGYRLSLRSRLSEVFVARNEATLIQTTSSTSINVPSNSIDYIFTDPPFGANRMYSELNFLWEAWLSLFTNNLPEAIVNRIQNKSMLEYQSLMEQCFFEFYRCLKPGRWITVEFHNSKSAVWNAIQEALLRSGFMIADVRTMAKGKGTFKQVTTTSAVKQDLIISAYKSRSDFEIQFKAEGGSLEGAWAFIRQHLEQLPIPVVDESSLMETLAERQAYLLYDRMVAFHIQRALTVPLSAAEFYQGLRQRFLERDEMYFTPVQAAEYDQRRLKAERVEQLALFVSDEKSAIQWVRRQLNPETGDGPQTYQDLQPKFLRELRQARHEELPELRSMLETNCLQDDSGRWYNPDPERLVDLEALRQKSLLREFSTYLQSKGRLKVFRSEAVRAGFSHAWRQRDYDAILQITERLPAAFLEEEQQLVMYVNNARLLAQREPKQQELF